MKYHIITYGCQMNEHDSENIAGLLEAMGYEHIDDPYRADVTVINTCSVRENADKRFFGTLGQFKKVRKNNPDFVLAVCGCMPQQPRVVEEINKRFSWVDIVFGTQNIAQFPQLLDERLKTGRRMRAVIDNNPDIGEEGMKPVRMHRHKALVNITYGCNNFCTYCIVPYTRGREKSRMLSEVCREIEALAADGVIEVMLLGQNVDSYRDAKGHTFADLIKAVNEIEGIERIRFMTSHPKDISDEMIDCFRTCDKLCHNIHLPVQSGSDRVLRRMNRRYDTARYAHSCALLRAYFDDPALTTPILGPERALKQFRCKTLWDSGALVTWSSDNVSYGDFREWSPYLGMEVGMTRWINEKTDAEEWQRTPAVYPPVEERMGIEEMLLGYTINGAIQLGVEDAKGSIEAGKDADFLVFDDDLLAAEREGFSHNKPSEVYMGGVKVN